MRIHKFHDLDANGNHDLGEPMLAGIHFEVVVDDQVYAGETGDGGLLTMCFAEGSQVDIRESKQYHGGQWSLTTNAKDLAFELSCGTRELWIGNAETVLPRTGLGGGRAREPSPPERRSSPAGTHKLL